MAVYDLEEQDKLDDLRAWWKQWGGLIVGVVVAVSIIVIGVQGWRWWTQRQTGEAAVLYDAISTAARANDPAKAKDAMAQLADQYGRTGYTPRAALIVAALLYENGDAAGAKTQLASVIDRSSEDELKQIARLRLASILFDEKQYDEALRTLDAKHDPSFAGVYSDARGDILAFAGRTDEARKAYQAAVTELDAKSPYRNFVQLKLDALAPPPAGPATSGAGTMPPAKVVAPAGPPVAAPAASSPMPGAPAPAAAPPQAAPTKAAPSPTTTAPATSK
ncbi:MAG: tetratricopeptide repeat protein [Betaproteobacteria bacterium]